MILSGDEIRRTQKGNNNAYCQNNELTWTDWRASQGARGPVPLLEADDRLSPAAIRPSTAPRSSTASSTSAACRTSPGTVVSSCTPGWDDPNARALAMTLAGFGAEADIHAILNMDWEGLDFEIPVAKGRRWRLAINTAEPSPHDIADPSPRRPLPEPHPRRGPQRRGSAVAVSL